MAYFSCRKAALTGTDQATRTSIAKGLVSPYFTDRSGKQVVRGVIQADYMFGRDISYADPRRQPAQTSQPTQLTSSVDLHSSTPAVIQPSKTFGFPVKTVAIMGIAGIVGYLVLIK